MKKIQLIDRDKLIEAIKYRYDTNYGEYLINPATFIDLVEDQDVLECEGEYDEQILFNR